MIVPIFPCSKTKLSRGIRTNRRWDGNVPYNIWEGLAEDKKVNSRNEIFQLKYHAINTKINSKTSFQMWFEHTWGCLFLELSFSLISCLVACTYHMYIWLNREKHCMYQSMRLVKKLFSSAIYKIRVPRYSLLYNLNQSMCVLRWHITSWY